MIKINSKVAEKQIFATCSPEDYDYLSKSKWHITDTYATASVKGKKIKMHHIVFYTLMGNEKSKDLCVDHKNGNRLDNRRENLRYASASQNAFNKRKRKTASSAYYGVVKYQGKYRASGLKEHLGYFETEIEAAEEYDRWLVHQPHFAQGFGTLNFPEKKDDYLTQYLPSKKQKRVRKSRYNGVFICSKGYIISQVMHLGKLAKIMTSKDELECAKAYDSYIVANNIKRPLNFPQDHPNYEFRKVIETIDVDSNTIRIICPNNPDAKVFIDKEDYEKIKYFRCQILKGYVTVCVRQRVLKALHRYILGIEDRSILVDHINNDPLDCRKSNLRTCNSSQNMSNRGKPSGTQTSKYIGVFRITKHGRFCAHATYDGKQLFRNEFKNEEDAARFRDLSIMKLAPGSYFKMNVEWTQEDIDSWAKRFNIVFQ